MNSFKKNVKIMLITTLVIKVFGFLYKILFARYFSIEVLSTISLLTPILSLCLVLSSMSIPTVINKHVSSSLAKETYYNRRIISSAIKITLISSSLIIIIFSSLSYFIATNIYHNSNLIIPIIICLPLLYFSNFSGIMKSYLEAHNDFKHPVISNLLEQIVKLVWIVLVIILFRNKSAKVITIAIALSLLIVEVVSNTYLTYHIKKMTPLKVVKTTIKDDKEVLRPSLYLTLFSLILTVSSFLEPIIYYSLTSHILIDSKQTELIYTSLHSFVYPFIQIASFLTYVLVKLLFPKMARTNDNKMLSYYFKLSFYILLFLNIILFNLSFFSSDSVMFLFYNRTEGSIILKILAPVTLLTFSSPILTMILESHGEEKKLLHHGIISIVLSLSTLTITSLCQGTALYSLIYSIIVKEASYFLLNLFYIFKKYSFKIKAIPLLNIILLIPSCFIINILFKNANIYLKIIMPSILIALLYLPLFIRRIRTKFN